MTNAANPSSEFSRKTPVVSLILTLMALAVHHWNGVTQGEIYPAFLLILFMFGGLAAGGAVHPPVFYSLGKYGQHLPTRLKVIAAACGLGSFAIGLYFLFRVY